MPSLAPAFSSQPGRHSMGWQRRPLLAGLFLICTSPLLCADLILTLSGTPDTKVVRYEATGSVALTESLTTGVNNQKDLRVPIGSVWSATFDAALGDFLEATAEDTRRLELSSGIELTVGDTTLAPFTLLDLDSNQTQDAFEIYYTAGAPSDYSALTSGDVVSWSGSGTFTLSHGSFAGHFRPGSYSTPINGGSFTLKVSAVPEPSGALLAFCSLLPILMRRQRCKRNEAL